MCEQERAIKQLSQFNSKTKAKHGNQTLDWGQSRAYPQSCDHGNEEAQRAQVRDERGWIVSRGHMTQECCSLIIFKGQETSGIGTKNSSPVQTSCVDGSEDSVSRTLSDPPSQHVRE